MSISTEYPVFESDQVLSHNHLNGLVEYLEQQDRLTRRKLIGIGIACGLKVNWKTGPEMLFISKGVAATSHGYIICLDENFYDRFITYTLPEQSMEQDNGDDVEEPPYPFFQNDNDEEIEMWELLSTDFVPEEGGEVPETLDQAFLQNKVVMVYLECERESLRNCDINDCSDKGAKMTFDVRVLAINEIDAIRIMEIEAERANLPVHQHAHPKYDLIFETIEKINPSRYKLKNFQEIYTRINDILNELRGSLPLALTSSFTAYNYLLREIYPEAEFPSGPFHDIDIHFSNVTNDFAQNILSLQYVYDFYYDIVQAYNEFVEEAGKCIAECCPNADRFPKHVLLGKAQPEAIAFLPDPVPATGSFNPLLANSGLKPWVKPLAYRHYFISSMIFKDKHSTMNRIKSLHYKLYLLAYRYDTELMKNAEIKITPSKDGDYSLSDKAIPFYYNFNYGDDFHANWSFNKTVTNRLDRVFSYQFTNDLNHPLLNKMEDHNFYRVEGHVGKGLATVLKNLGSQRKNLGLSFSIEPVFIGTKGDKKSDKKEMQDLMTAGKRLFLCKMRDLDVIFLILITVLFFFLFLLLMKFSRIGRGGFGLGRSIIGGASRTDTERLSASSFDGDFINKKITREESDRVLSKIRQEKGYVKGTVIEEINKNLKEENLGNIYLEINAEPSTMNLCDRTFTVVNRTIKDKVKAKKIADELYPIMTLIDNTEGLMGDLGAKEFKDFSVENFENKYEAFTSSYQNLIAREPADDLKKNIAYQEARVYAVENKGKLASTGAQSLFGGLKSELSRRLLNILSEFTLPGYAKKYPGLEHKAGVPKSGTLVLLYARRDFVEREFAKVIENLRGGLTNGSNIGSIREIGSTGTPNLSILETENISAINVNASTNILTNAVSGDPLDNFIVLGDFCLPDRCCDNDCGDLYDEEVRVVNGRIGGKVTDERTGEIVKHAKVGAINLSTDELRETGVDNNGDYSFELPAASYRVGAGAANYDKVSETKTIGPGEQIELSFQLRQVQKVDSIAEIENGSAGYDVNSALGKEALRYYGGRAFYYKAYPSKLDAIAATDSQKELARQVKSTIGLITSPDINLTKLNNEIKRANSSLAQLLDSVENERAKTVVNESIRTVNSAYLDKLSLLSKEKLTTGTKNTLKTLEEMTKKSKARLSNTIEDWTSGFNLSVRPQIVKELAKIKIK